MGILDTILGATRGPQDTAHPGGPAANGVSLVGGLIQQHGGLQGLMTQFSSNGLGDVFSSWVGLGENKQISEDQIQQVLGSEQVTALAQKLGVDPAQATALISQYLPKVIDKLTPAGQVDPNHDVEGGLAGLLQGGLGKLLG